MSITCTTPFDVIAYRSPSAEIASTKELVTMRTNRDRTRLYIANGTDESATDDKDAASAG